MDLYQVAEFLVTNRELGVGVQDWSEAFHLADTKRIEDDEKKTRIMRIIGFERRWRRLPGATRWGKKGAWGAGSAWGGS